MKNCTARAIGAGWRLITDGSAVCRSSASLCASGISRLNKIDKKVAVVGVVHGGQNFLPLEL